MATAVELEKTLVLVAALDAENEALTKRLETEKQASALLVELAATRRSESEALRSALTAKNETIAAKDVVIAKQDDLVTTLKNKKPSLIKRLGDVLIGAAAALVLR